MRGTAYAVPDTVPDTVPYSALCVVLRAVGPDMQRNVQFSTPRSHPPMSLMDPRTPVPRPHVLTPDRTIPARIPPGQCQLPIW
ncbi:hypothetical protein GCM10009654_62140 [Streptomyces hebeiensis]|uniref:Uncharacterized protein n=1 Tax=Streptomyces hebeiensis TaxID=229486 RepID=A0ABP4FTE5_9ACTN